MGSSGACCQHAQPAASPGPTQANAGLNLCFSSIEILVLKSLCMCARMCDVDVGLSFVTVENRGQPGGVASLFTVT